MKIDHYWRQIGDNKGFVRCVNPWDCNPMAHGGVTRKEIRRRRTGQIILRLANVNGAHVEYGTPREIEKGEDPCDPSW